MTATLKMLTPTELRRFASLPDNLIIPITSDKGAMLADALEIADESAWCLIQSETALAPTNHGSAWRDLTSADPASKGAIFQALRYLDARGLLNRHAENARWVSLRVAA